MLEAIIFMCVSISFGWIFQEKLLFRQFNECSNWFRFAFSFQLVCSLLWGACYTNRYTYTSMRMYIHQKPKKILTINYLNI